MIKCSRGKGTGLKTDAEAGANGEHEGVFRAIGLEDRFGGLEIPRYLGLDIQAECSVKAYCMDASAITDQ